MKTDELGFLALFLENYPEEKYDHSTGATDVGYVASLLFKGLTMTSKKDGIVKTKDIIACGDDALDHYFETPKGFFWKLISYKSYGKKRPITPKMVAEKLRFLMEIHK